MGPQELTAELPLVPTVQGARPAAAAAPHHHSRNVVIHEVGPPRNLLLGVLGCPQAFEPSYKLFIFAFQVPPKNLLRF